MSTNYDKWGHEPIRDENSHKTMRAVVLTTITIILLLVGTLMWLAGLVGWAQAAWIIASGLSGASIVTWMERYW